MDLILFRIIELDVRLTNVALYLAARAGQLVSLVVAVN